MSLSVIKNIICQLGIAESAKAIILENALNKISEAVLISIDKAKSDKAFKELFGSLKEKVIVNEQFKNVNDELTNIFYSPEFDELCKIKRIGNEYDYIDAVREYLVSILDKYDIKYNLQDKIIEQFVTELLEEIKHKDEDLYKKICDSELYKDSRKFNRRVYKTIDDYDNDLKVNTKITTGLDFFVIDDSYYDVKDNVWQRTFFFCAMLYLNVIITLILSHSSIVCSSPKGHNGGACRRP